MISRELRLVYELFWRPGLALHATWWAELDMIGFEAVYRRSSYCRVAVDGLIRERAGLCSFESPSNLNDFQRWLIASREKIGSIVVVLGLLALDCRENLFLGTYRRALAEFLTSQDVEHLLSVSSVPVLVAQNVTPETVSQLSQQLGLRWLDRDLERDPIWACLRLLQPALSRTSDEYFGAPEALPIDNVMPSLGRVGRLL
ncbi:type III secretion system domain-containing protein [Paraburkholderia sediminicola]|uniref:type III secretion system domain-containing protein n=1 Tax=Paraburkholderia sediminicola TaxID=458836 RepID=UPI0038B94282